MVVKTFRGILADGGQDRIRLQTIKGKMGYKIIKFQIVTSEPGEHQHESTVKIYKKEQTTIDNTINFTDNNLLAVSIWESGTETGRAIWIPLVTIFDQEIFNQDIFITHSETDGANPINYYIELEVIPLDDAGAEYTTLKDMRST